MPEHPLLIFPAPTLAKKAARHGGGGKLKKPSAESQGRRLIPQFERLQQALENKRLTLQDNPFGIQPEQVLVLETIGPIDNFVKAAQKVGLEWIGEFELEDMEPADGFADENDPEKLLKGRLFLVMSDQRALAQLRRLFELWQGDPDAKFPHGLAPIRNAFVHLKAIRPWDAEDRIRDTGIYDDWQMRQEIGQATVPFEAELWFRQSAEQRDLANRYVSNIIRELDGTIEDECMIPDIAYHAILGRIPIEHVASILELRDVSLIRCEDVMQLRPIGQCAFRSAQDLDTTVPLGDDQIGDLPEGDPEVALFDGLPLTGHRLLNGRIIVDDPDGFEDGYQARDRGHGTAMASLICHGDLLEANPPLKKPIYVRPILKAVSGFGGRTREAIPENILPVDLIYRAVRRIFEGDGDEAPAGSGIRVINLSVCDPSHPFDRGMSPWARLLDWLSWKYKVLFIVSAGNHADNIELDLPRQGFAALSAQQIEEAVIRAIAANTRHRRLLSPAETLNGLTLGAEHYDISVPKVIQNLINPFTAGGRPSVISAHGPGYRRSIKPDILLPGGRQFLSERHGNTHPNATLLLSDSTSAPGQLVASPGPANQLDRTFHMRGTSNSAALATRWSSQILELIEQLRNEYGGDIPIEYDVVLLKALLVHGADWSGIDSLYRSVLRNPANSTLFNDYVARFYGYGKANVAKVLECTEQRVTVLGVGELRENGGNEFVFPLPPSLSATTEKRRLTITLGWLTPISSTNQKYRVAQLWFDPKNKLAPSRMCGDHAAVKRGTVQHEVLEGSQAVDFQDGETINVLVSCVADAGPLATPIRYGLAVTLEVGDGVEIPIYQEVQARLQIPVPVQQ